MGNVNRNCRFSVIHCLPLFLLFNVNLGMFWAHSQDEACGGRMFIVEIIWYRLCIPKVNITVAYYKEL